MIRHSLLPILLVMLSGCTGVQIHDSTQFQVFNLSPGELSKFGLVFLTPSTPTGQEEDKQALALGFAEVMQQTRPDICYVSLPETLAAINGAGLADAYRDMYEEYRNTGILKKTVLTQLRDQLHSRYLLQLKLANFRQESNSRFGFFGFRIVDTKLANIRLFVQIWDADTGSIVFEAIQELNYADDTMSERPVSFKQIVEETAKRVIAKLP
jgi:hypothetical protein